MISENRWSGDVPTGDSYDERWRKMAASGQSLHGEADFVTRWVPTGAVLDAGCGTGRVAIELAARGFDVVGVDANNDMLVAALEKAPALRWILGDLAALSLEETFDAVVMAGNVMIFVVPGTEAEVVRRCAAHLRPGGRLIAGFQLGRGYEPDVFDLHAQAAGLHLEHRFASWDEDPFAEGAYQVSIHRL